MSSVSSKSDKMILYHNQSEIKQLPKPAYRWDWDEHVGERDGKCAYSVAYRLLRKGLIFREDDKHRVSNDIVEYLEGHGVDLKDIDVSDRGDITQTRLCDDIDVSRSDCSTEIEDELSKYNSDSRQLTLDGEDAAELMTDLVIAERWEAEIDSSDVDTADGSQMRLVYDSYESEDWDYNTRDECSSNNDNSDSEQVTLDSFSRSARFWARQGF